jgi:RNA polymerase sigma factor (sigma-70 family)
MQESAHLAELFERQRPHLKAVAYRMLGSLSEADDAVQETWLRLTQSDTHEGENFRAWTTTIVARVSLNLLRARRSRREEPIAGHVPDLILSPAAGADPEQEVLLSGSVGLALLVVLDTLAPAERLAFVLHDLFDVPYEELGSILDRTPAAARQLASRARRRVRGQVPASDHDMARHREAVAAFFAAARDGDFDRLVAVLHPDVVERHDGGTTGPAASFIRRGARIVADQALAFASMAPYAKPLLVNGSPGVLAVPGGRVFSVMAFTVADGLIVQIFVVTDPARLQGLDLASLGIQPSTFPG